MKYLYDLSSVRISGVYLTTVFWSLYFTKDRDTMCEESLNNNFRYSDERYGHPTNPIPACRSKFDPHSKIIKQTSPVLQFSLRAQETKPHRPHKNQRLLQHAHRPYLTIQHQRPWLHQLVLPTSISATSSSSASSSAVSSNGHAPTENRTDDRCTMIIVPVLSRVAPRSIYSQNDNKVIRGDRFHVPERR